MGQPLHEPAHDRRGTPERSNSAAAEQGLEAAPPAEGGDVDTPPTNGVMSPTSADADALPDSPTATAKQVAETT